MGLTKSQRRTRDNLRLLGALVGGVAMLLLLMLNGILWMFGVRLMHLDAASKYVRQGVGGRFRQVPASEVLDAMRPVANGLERAKRIAANPGVATAVEMRARADELDAACDDFEGQNYSFAHKRSARAFNEALAEARQAARDLRAHAGREIDES